MVTEYKEILSWLKYDSAEKHKSHFTYSVNKSSLIIYSLLFQDNTLISVKDPRPRYLRFWSKRIPADLPVPKFLVSFWLTLTFILLEFKVISLCHQYRLEPGQPAHICSLTLYCGLTNFKF